MTSDNGAPDAELVAIEPGVVVSHEDSAKVWPLMDHIATYLLPLVRAPSHQLLVLPDAESYREVGQHGDEFIKEGWDHSEWVSRTIAQADSGKEPIVVAFNRYRSDESPDRARVVVLHAGQIEDRWGIRGRSSFAKWQRGTLAGRGKVRLRSPAVALMKSETEPVRVRLPVMRSSGPRGGRMQDECTR